jgi:uncharacterized membrane protein
MTLLKGYIAAVMTGIGWIWAVTLLATRCHETGNYTLTPTSPLFWGNFGAPAPGVLFALSVGIFLAIDCGYVVRSKNRFCTPPVCWLMVSWLIPALDLFRLAGTSIPMTFLEPLLVAGVTGAAAGWLADLFYATPQAGRQSSVLPLAVCLLAILSFGWWYHEAQQAYDSYLLGYNDFGHFGWRIANTWEGRGFLLETPGFPAFWDHFNPGLALLAPLWALWPDPRLFLLIQAICLAAPSPIVYGIARQLGATPAAAAAWATAYLVFPAVGQLNLNYSYGWHPVSLALPLIFLALWALLRSWRSLACAAALLACSFQEDIIAVLCCLAFALAFQAWLDRRRPPERRSDCPRLPADALPVWGWLIVAAMLGLAFVAVFQLAPFSQLQTSRFADLGNSASEVLLSPVVRPALFWGAMLRSRCGYFLLCLTIPLGLRALANGWSTLLAVALPIAVLLAWSYPSATSIAFQYTTALIPILFLAAMIGSVTLRPTSPASREIAVPGNPSRSLWRTGMTALAAGATASLSIGAMPWSSPTLTDMISQTYVAGGNVRVCDARDVGSPENALLNQVVARVRRRESTVLATGRIAAHLLAVRRIDTVGQVCARRKDLAEEAGPNRSPIELFDWVVLDTNERFFQSLEELRWVIDCARRARYQCVQSERGILVLARPSTLAEE